MRILHIAPNNIAGVPIAFVRAERALGHESRLVTFVKDARGYEEDICLNLPFLDFAGTLFVKRLVSNPAKLHISNQRARPGQVPLEWQPNGVLEAGLVRLREAIWQPKLQRLFTRIDFWGFDVYQLDGGLEFYRDGRTVKALRQRGKKIVCCYTGSDLRTRGVIPAVDQNSQVNVTLEFDHLKLHPNIHHVPFPFEVDQFEIRSKESQTGLRIGHAPTNRAAKGSDIIIRTINELQQEVPIELVLIENVSHRQSIALKQTCHIFVDQVGDLGYGLNSLEALAMGIATCSSLPEDFEKLYPDHPFIAVDPRNLKSQLLRLIQNPDRRAKLASTSRQWVEKRHDSRNVVRKVHALIDAA